MDTPSDPTSPDQTPETDAAVTDAVENVVSGDELDPVQSVDDAAADLDDAALADAELADTEFADAELTDAEFADTEFADAESAEAEFEAAPVDAATGRPPRHRRPLWVGVAAGVAGLTLGLGGAALLGGLGDGHHGDRGGHHLDGGQFSDGQFPLDGGHGGGSGHVDIDGDGN